MLPRAKRPARDPGVARVCGRRGVTRGDASWGLSRSKRHPKILGKEGSWTASRRELGPFGSPRMGAGRECAELRVLGCCSIPMVWGMRNWPSSGAARAPFLAPLLAPGHPQHRCPHAVPCHQPEPRATQQLGQKVEMLPDLGLDDAGLLEHPAAHAVVSLPQKSCTRPPTPARGAARSPTARRTSATATPSARATTTAARTTTSTADPVGTAA